MIMRRYVWEWLVLLVVSVAGLGTGVAVDMTAANQQEGTERTEVESKSITSPVQENRFGLVPNDPEHDNGPILAKALMAGRRVELAPGTYWTSEVKLSGRKPWHLVGRGIGCNLRRPADAVVLRAMPGTKTILSVRDVASGCRIERLALEDNASLPAEKRADGIVIRGCESWRIADCTFSGLGTGLAVINTPGPDGAPGKRIWSLALRGCFAKQCEVGFSLNGRGKGTMGCVAMTDCLTELTPVSLTVESWRRGLSIRNYAAHRGLIVLKRSRVLVDGMYAELVADDPRAYPIRLKRTEYSFRGVLGKVRIEDSVACDGNQLGVYRPPRSLIPSE